jgi:RNA polymerase sigma factor (sigma-70 family)
MPDDEIRAELLSDRSLLGYDVRGAAEDIARRGKFSDLSAADRDELVGVAISKYYETWGPLGRPDNIEAWLSRVMHNALMDQHRARRWLVQPVARDDDGSVQALFERWSPSLPSLSTTIVNEAATRAFLRGLKSSDAQLLWLKAHGFSSREIADLLHITSNAVDVRLHRLRLKLKAFVD